MFRRSLLTVIVAYTVLLGATYNGILNAQLRLIDAILVGGVLLVWAASRWRSRWQWHGTALEWAILLWIAAFALSLVANLDVWRRIAIGLWFMGLYIGAWYILQDFFANRALRREWLVDALLITGVPILFVGFAQVEVALVDGLALPRPVGTLGNANALGALIAMLLPLVAGRLMTAKNPLTRSLLGVYGLAALVLLALSFSRGGWIGAAVALAVWASLSFPLRRWWDRLSRPLHALLLIGALGGVALGAYIIVESLGIGGRGLDVRTWIYETALHLFANHPLTGTGLFTFGAGLAGLNSLPPFEPHSHAHNIILHVAAELGIVGLAALALTAWLALRAARRARGDRTAVMGIAAFAGVAAHQMFDVPAMMPAIALVGLALLVLALPTVALPVLAEPTVTDPVVIPDPVKRKRIQPGWHPGLQPMLIAGGGVVLALIGLWGALNYREYVAALSEGVASGDYGTAAARVEALAESDPSLAIYPEEAGMLYGLAAAGGDLAAAQAGVDSFARYVALEPSYASGWANLAALDEQLGKLPEAAAAMHQAALLASQSWSIFYREGVYEEATGDEDAARASYQQALALNSYAVLLPDWNDSPLRMALSANYDRLSVVARTLLRLEAGDASGAQQLWDLFAGRTRDVTSYHAISAILALEQGDRAQAQTELAAARRAVVTPSDQAWTHLGAALAVVTDDGSQYEAQIALARAEISGTPTGADWDLGANIAYIQYLHLAIPRVFLPQVGYTEIDTLLLHVFGSPDALTTLHAATQP